LKANRLLFHSSSKPDMNLIQEEYSDYYFSDYTTIKERNTIRDDFLLRLN